MKLFTKAQYEQLLNNGSPQNRTKDHKPVVKLFAGSSMTWLLTELDPDTPSIAFGLCDLGMGYPEIGYVDLEELESVSGKAAVFVERDRYFEAEYPISVYAKAARLCQYITEDKSLLAKCDKQSVTVYRIS